MEITRFDICEAEDLRCVSLSAQAEIVLGEYLLEHGGSLWRKKDAVPQAMKAALGDSYAFPNYGRSITKWMYFARTLHNHNLEYLHDVFSVSFREVDFERVKLQDIYDLDASETEINYLSNCQSNVQGQLNALSTSVNLLSGVDQQTLSSLQSLLSTDGVYDLRMGAIEQKDTQQDTTLSAKADSSTLVADYRRKDDSYDQGGVNTLLATKVDTSTLASYTTSSTLVSDYRRKDDSYDQGQVAALVTPKADTTTLVADYRRKDDSYDQTSVDGLVTTERLRITAVEGEIEIIQDHETLQTIQAVVTAWEQGDATLQGFVDGKLPIGTHTSYVSQTDTALGLRYTKTESDTTFRTKIDSMSAADITGLLGQKENADTAYEKSVSDGRYYQKSETYTQGEVTTFLSGKAGTSDSYLKAAADVLLAAKADDGDSYLKAAADVLLAAKADDGDSYLKAATDSLLAAKQGTVGNNDLQVSYTLGLQSALDLKATTSSVTALGNLVDALDTNLLEDKVEVSVFNTRSTAVDSALAGK